MASMILALYIGSTSNIQNGNDTNMRNLDIYLVNLYGKEFRLRENFFRNVEFIYVKMTDLS